MILILIVAIVYSIPLLVFSIGFLINWYRNRTAISAYKSIGLWAGVIFVIFEVLTLALSGGSTFGSLCLGLALMSWGVLRLWGFVNNGIFFSNQLNLRSFPLIAPSLGLPAPVETPVVDPGAVPWPDQAAAITAVPLPARRIVSIPLRSAETTIEPLLPPVNWLRYGLSIIGIVVGTVAYSAVLFRITQPGPGLVAQNMTPSNATVLTPLTLVIGLEFAYMEELLFRLGIQNYLGAKLVNKRYGYALAIVLTAALWSLGHVGSLNPDWVKLAQVFPLGLALGWLYRRQGVESTILAHGLFNVLGSLLLSPLVLR